MLGHTTSPFLYWLSTHLPLPLPSCCAAELWMNKSLSRSGSGLRLCCIWISSNCGSLTRWLRWLKTPILLGWVTHKLESGKNNPVNSFDSSRNLDVLCCARFSAANVQSPSFSWSPRASSTKPLHGFCATKYVQVAPKTEGPFHSEDANVKNGSKYARSRHLNVFKLHKMTPTSVQMSHSKQRQIQREFTDVNTASQIQKSSFVRLRATLSDNEVCVHRKISYTHFIK